MLIRVITALLMMCFLFGGSLFSQSFILNEGCGLAKELVVDVSGINAVSKNSKDTLYASEQNGSVYYCSDGSSVSSWYKIFVNADCEISFAIYPMQKENRYNFFFYRQSENTSICDINDKKVEPIRANLFAEEMFVSGTGLSTSSSITFYDTTSKDMQKDFYHTAYHASVSAKTGEVYFLNIYHVNGNDCGYRFSLKANAFTRSVESLVPICFSEKIKTEKTKQYVNPYPLRYISDVTKPAVNQVPVALPPKPVVEEAPKAVFIVRDSLKHMAVDAEVVRIQKGKSPASKPAMTVNGKYELPLENNSRYHLVFNCLGYKAADVYFVTAQNAKSFTDEVYLTPYKAGDNFIMDKLYFYPNSYTMKPEAKGELNELLSYLKNNPGTSIEIQGHTNGNNRIRSSYGSEFKGSSKKLSQYRSDMIKKFLVENGISADRLTAIGYGGSKMIYEDPKTQAQADRNIRVEVLILSQKGTALTDRSK